MRLLIISHMPHYLRNGQVVGWGPTAQEIDHLAQFFDEIRHIACLHPTPAPDSSLAYTKSNIHFVPVAPSGGTSIREKIQILFQYPSYLKTIMKELKNADVVHVRAPASISMLAMVILTFRRKPAYRWIKYAGNWQPEIQDAWSYRFQRWWLKRNLHRGAVTINGRWAGQETHIHSFLNPCMYEVEIMEGKQAGMNKQITSPLRLLYVGLMASFKGVGRVLKMAESLRAKNIPFFVDLVGGGIEQQKFEDQARQLNLQEHVHFHGWQQKNALQAFYSKAHFIILPSATEGWPKVLSEGMAFGAVPLAGAVSSIPQILQESGAGLSFPVEDTDAFVNAIEDFAQHPDKWKQRSEAGIHWAPRFTYQAYQQHVLQMFQEVWGIDLAKKTGAEKI